jgi:hypothetical protein
MSQFRAAGPAVAAAACASVCMLLSGCSGGSIAPTANGTPAAGSPAASSAGSSSGSSGSAPGAVSTAGLTGNFCADFSNMGQNLKTLPTPKDNGDLAAQEATARQDLSAVEGTFNGLATEAPPDVAAAIHNITALYQTEIGNLGSFNSAGQIAKEEKDLTSNGAYLKSIEVLIEYATSHCH